MTDVNENPIRPMLSDQTYDRVKWIVQTALPLVASLYFSLAQIWNFPASEEIVGTLAIGATFLGAILGVSTKRYNASDLRYDGAITVDASEDGKKIFSLVIDDNPENLTEKEFVTFKIVQ